MENSITNYIFIQRTLQYHHKPPPKYDFVYGFWVGKQFWASCHKDEDKLIMELGNIKFGKALKMDKDKSFFKLYVSQFYIIHSSSGNTSKAVLLGTVKAVGVDFKKQKLIEKRTKPSTQQTLVPTTIMRLPRVPRLKTFNIIKLAYHGCTNRPFFHIVLLSNKSSRDATPFEQLGTYDPMPNVFNEKLVSLDVERIKYHLAHGVAMSKPVEKLLGLSGLLPVHPMSYITAKRNRKKALAASATCNEDSTEKDSS